MHGTPLFLFPPYQKPTIQRIAPLAQCGKNRRRAVVHVIPRPANNLYNRSSAVDPLRHNQPQVGKPTWGYDYTTALRRLPLPSAVIPKNALTHRPTSPKTPSAHRPPPPKTPSAHQPPSPKPAIINGLRQRRNAKKTAEERFHTLARGWLAYPVTSIHSHLPPKSGCICHPTACK